MTATQLIADLTDDVVLGAFFGSLFFIVSYTITTPWWRHAIGMTLVVLDAGLVLTLAPGVLHRLFGLPFENSQFFKWYFLASLTLVAGGVWWRSLVMLKLNWHGRRDRKLERKE